MHMHTPPRPGKSGHAAESSGRERLAAANDGDTIVVLLIPGHERRAQKLQSSLYNMVMKHYHSIHQIKAHLMKCSLVLINSTFVYSVLSGVHKKGGLVKGGVAIHVLFLCVYC